MALNKCLICNWTYYWCKHSFSSLACLRQCQTTDIVFPAAHWAYFEAYSLHSFSAFCFILLRKAGNFLEGISIFSMAKDTSRKGKTQLFKFMIYDCYDKEEIFFCKYDVSLYNLHANYPIFFWMVWKARNRIAFEDHVLSIQRLKSSFVCFLWSETKLFIKDGPSTLVSFIDWLGSHWRWGFFCTSLLTAVFAPVGWGLVYLFCLLWVVVLAPLFKYIFTSLYLSKK